MTPKEIAALEWGGTWCKAALVNTTDGSMPFSVGTKNEQDIKWLQEIKSKLDLLPEHPLYGKLELVYRPE